MVSVVLKTVERCNINCTYCYFFNKNDQSYKEHSPYISRETINQTGQFLLQGSEDLNFSNILLSIHGGEPLMQDLDDFDYMCSSITALFHGKKTSIEFTLQTNAMLVNKDWIDLFNKHKVHIGISIDGPKIYHDKFRIDKKGKGTFDRTVEKIHLLNKFKKNFDISILCVTNPSFNPKTIFDFFKNELKINQFDFLLPDAHHSDLPSHDVEQYGNFFSKLFDILTAEGLDKFKIRFLNNIIRDFLNFPSTLYGQSVPKGKTMHPFTISSDGNLSPVDDLRNTDSKIMNTGLTIYNSTLQNFFNHSFFKDINQVLETPPKKCHSCCWQTICNGGNLIHRYKVNQGFTNETIYCDALKKIYGKVAAHLIKDGYSIADLEKRLCID